jgi:hypothetical protein
MSLSDTVETYKYFITEVEKLDLSYITLVRYGASFDVKFDGWCFLLPPKQGGHALISSTR